MNQPAAPRKLFREEAQTGAIECPGCGAPITLHAFGAIEQVACAYCGTVATPEDDGSLALLQKAQRQRRESVLPLHRRGTIAGVEWEIIGVCWREVRDGGTYPWQEFLLFNPYQGYRWLIYAMTDGQWSFGGSLPGAAKAIPSSRPAVEYAGELYAHFTTGNAYTTYVEGEFPWQVLVGDVAQTNDYICPPKLISIEVQRADEGADINFTCMGPIDAGEVWQAFQMPGSPPSCTGVHPAATNPYKTKFYWIAALVLFALWAAAIVVYSGGRANEAVLDTTITPGESLTQEIEIGEDGHETTLSFELRAQGMSNSWAYVEVLLVDPDTEEAIAVPLEVDAWSGVDQGESWSEGTNPRRATIGGVPGGTYLMQVGTQLDTSTTGDKADQLQLRIRQDVPLTRYILLPLLFIFGFPLINLARKGAFEAQRMSTSDYAMGDD
ncbi:DUF4178 domain-containing protein [Pseudenhygromyxa sp. WMMC2535]|uniref:DUF4178 domain-containing protein n=1 Tax=Pseudenhygromyxa sp. WMMC2535 TaxID=2712867 RepID=UPI001558227A|nr:DUF4178 domain-containing protein [Pseudenhygromyxa sp. WMMC2535]NVB43364.1 DUF4178 domain-containing protein [Pseudenhygromyxa sp. WMMC2535]